MVLLLVLVLSVDLDLLQDLLGALDEVLVVNVGDEFLEAGFVEELFAANDLADWPQLLVQLDEVVEGGGVDAGLLLLVVRDDLLQVENSDVVDCRNEAAALAEPDPV